MAGRQGTPISLTSRTLTATPHLPPIGAMSCLFELVDRAPGLGPTCHMLRPTAEIEAQDPDELVPATLGFMQSDLTAVHSSDKERISKRKVREEEQRETHPQ